MRIYAVGRDGKAVLQARSPLFLCGNCSRYKSLSHISKCGKKRKRMLDYDADFLRTIADLLDRMQRRGEGEGLRTIVITDNFARELAAGLRRIADRIKPDYRR
jgi:hypothetical protein